MRSLPSVYTVYTVTSDYRGIYNSTDYNHDGVCIGRAFRAEHTEPPALRKLKMLSSAAHSCADQQNWL